MQQFISDEIIEKTLCHKNLYYFRNQLVIALIDKYVNSCKILDLRDDLADYDRIESGEDFDIICESYDLMHHIDIRTPNLPSMLKASNIQSFNIDNLPIELRYLHIYDIMPKSIPPYLELLICDGNFNEPLYELPDSIACIILGPCFNQPILQLPKNLKYLHFGQKFTHQLDANIIPPTIKKIYI